MAVLILSSFTPAWATLKETPIEPAQKKLEVGEELVFDVRWMGIPIGTGVLKVLEKTLIAGQECFHVLALAKTNEALSTLFPVNDEVHSFIDAAHWRSLEFRKKLSEGRYRADEKVVYDYPEKKGFFESVRNKSKEAFAAPASAQDFLSAFYWFRTQDIKVGKCVRTVINDKGKSWDLEIDILKREIKELRGGRVMDSVLVEPKTSYNGVLYNRGRVWVYVTADSRRVPFWVKIATPFGPVVGVLRVKEAA